MFKNKKLRFSRDPTCCGTLLRRTAKPSYLGVWADTEDFDEVLISPHCMVEDHMPDSVLDALNKVRHEMFFLLFMKKFLRKSFFLDEVFFIKNKVRLFFLQCKKIVPYEEGTISLNEVRCFFFIKMFLCV